MKNNIQIQTLTRKDIEKLAMPKRGGHWAISLYLGIRGDQNFLSVANSVLSEGKKKLEEEKQFSESDRKKIYQAFQEIESELRTRRLTDRTQTYVMFFTAKGKGKIYKLPVYIPTTLIVEEDFYVHPFIKSFDKYPRYAVVFLERDRARIFDLLWGEIEHKTEEIRSEVPQRMNAARATWKGLEERKIQNHIEVHINRHLEKVAKAVENYMDKNKIPYLVIGSRRELIDRFREYLPKRLQAKIVGSYLTRTDQDISKIRKRSSEVIAAFEYAQEEDLVEKLSAESSKKVKSAVWGIENVLGYLRDYQIRTLIIGKDYREAGYVCEDKHHPFFRRGACPVCEGVAASAGDIVDEIIEEAMRQKADIIHFQFEHPDFDRFGIGAILK